MRRADSYRLHFFLAWPEIFSQTQFPVNFPSPLGEGARRADEADSLDLFGTFSVKGKVRLKTKNDLQKVFSVSKAESENPGAHVITKTNLRQLYSALIVALINDHPPKTIKLLLPGTHAG